jgi:diguanylate cyclase (GGDEF)-like protein/PAS domain S-box-containing protein
MKLMLDNVKSYMEMTKGELIHELTMRDKKIAEMESKRTRNAAKLRRLATVIFDSNDAITVQELDGTITAWNKGAERMYSYNEVEALGMNILDIVPKTLKEETIDLLRQIKSGRHVDSLETKRVSKDGRVLDVWLTLTKLTDDKGDVIAVATTERDITERKQMEHELQMASITDEMTGLYNRRGLKLFAEKTLLQSERTNNPVLLFYCDLDNLKLINDSFGHREGDRAIKAFAGILKKTFRKSDIIARLGGDEFAVLVTGTNKPGSEQTIRENIRENICRHNEDNWTSHELDVSIGVSCYDALHPCTIDELLERADNAMYEEKKQKKRTPPVRDKDNPGSYSKKTGALYQKEELRKEKSKKSEIVASCNWVTPHSAVYYRTVSLVI